jgi:hypothetical protein
MSASSLGFQPGEQSELPLFLLGTVLFPGGRLPLKVFEARYTDMVRQCIRQSTPFGVCLVTEGSEVATERRASKGRFEAIGCSASIDQFDMEQLGLLMIDTSGGQRFEVLDHEVRRNNLVVAQVQWLAPDEPLALPQEYHALADLLDRIARETELLQGDLQLDDGVWVSNRISELLPVPPSLKQRLMALPEASARLMLAQDILAKATGSRPD